MSELPAMNRSFIEKFKVWRLSKILEKNFSRGGRGLALDVAILHRVFGVAVECEMVAKNPVRLVMDASVNGRGTITVTSSGQPSKTFVFYMISPQSVFVVSGDSMSTMTGAAQIQSGGPFSNSSFSGSYGYTVNGLVPSTGITDSSGKLLPDGSTNLTNLSGTADTNQSGQLVPYQPLSGGYTVSSNGRATLAVLPSGSQPSQYVMYIVDSEHVFLLLVGGPSAFAGFAALQF